MEASWVGCDDSLVTCIGRGYHISGILSFLASRYGSDYMSNTYLLIAQKRKRDEFYTLYSTIVDEIELYFQRDPNVFRDKIIYCPCDNHKVSNFTKYFKDNFERFGLKKLISSCYSLEYQDYFDSSLFEDEPIRFEEHGTVEIAEGTGERVYSLKGNGDIMSKECQELLQESDIIVTNPPFSLFSKIIRSIFFYKKRLLLLGNLNAVTYKHIFPLIRSNQLWLGHSIWCGDREFLVHDNYPFQSSNCRVDDDGCRYIKVTGVRWFTNLHHGIEKKFLEISTMEENLKGSLGTKLCELNTYVKYDNFNAIEVPITEAIPSDYKGVMGVPISFMDKYNPEQFEIIGISDTSYNGLTEMVFDGNGSDYPIAIKGRALFKRIFIRHRR